MRQRCSDVTLMGNVAFLAPLLRSPARIVVFFAREVRVLDVAFLTVLVSFVLAMPLSSSINADDFPALTRIIYQGYVSAVFTLTQLFLVFMRDAFAGAR